MSCPKCGSRLYKPTCKFCKALPVIRAALPENFEHRTHLTPPGWFVHSTRNYRIGSYYPSPIFSWAAICIQDLVTTSGIELFHWAHYSETFMWQPGRNGPLSGIRCEDCLAGFHYMEASYRFQRDQESARIMTSKNAAAMAQNVEVCRACAFPYFKVTKQAQDPNHWYPDVCNPEGSGAFNALKLCGSCIDRLRTGPLFENFLQVMLDDAYSRDVIKRRS